MKISIKILVFTIFLLTVSCTAFNVKRGANKECNCFYSSQQPSVKITFADNYYFHKNFNKADHLNFLWEDKNKYLWIFVNYRMNTAIRNRIDYYFPIDKVLYNSYGSINMNLGYGEEIFHGYKFYYCDYIQHKNEEKIYIIRDMVLPSYDHDWIQIRMGHTFKHPNFSESFSTGSDYFTKYPKIKELFYKKIRCAIKSIEPFDVNNTIE